MRERGAAQRRGEGERPAQRREAGTAGSMAAPHKTCDRRGDLPFGRSGPGCPRGRWSRCADGWGRSCTSEETGWRRGEASAGPAAAAAPVGTSRAGRIGFAVGAPCGMETPAALGSPVPGRLAVRRTSCAGAFRGSLSPGLHSPLVLPPGPPSRSVRVPSAAGSTLRPRCAIPCLLCRLMCSVSNAMQAVRCTSLTVVLYRRRRPQPPVLAQLKSINA